LSGDFAVQEIPVATSVVIFHDDSTEEGERNLEVSTECDSGDWTSQIPANVRGFDWKPASEMPMKDTLDDLLKSLWISAGPPLQALLFWRITILPYRPSLLRIT
jgi:hypothetical protein